MSDKAVLVEKGPSGTNTRQWTDVAAMVEALVRDVPAQDAMATLRHLAFVASVEDACQDVRAQIARNFQDR